MDTIQSRDRYGVGLGPDARWSAAILLLALACPGAALAQDVDISGYYEHTLQLLRGKGGKTDLIDASKLRVDLSSGLGSSIEFRANVNFLAYHSDLEQDIAPYLPDAVVRDLEAAGFPTTYTMEGSRTWLDNAFLSWTSGGLSVRAGKQQLSWGPAYSFNPTDLFHRKDPLDPTYEKEGVAALRMDYRWGIGGQVSVITAPRGDFESSGYAVRLGTHLSSIGYDVAFTAHQVEDTTGLDPSTLLPVRQRRRAQGIELSGALLGTGVWLEGNYNQMELEEDFARVAFGMDYTTVGGTYLMGEALYNGRAERQNPYPTHDWLSGLYYGEPVGRWWILTGARRDMSALTATELYLFSSPDGSFALNPRFEASIAQNADLLLFGGFTFGTEDGVYPPGLTFLVARATVYF